jgi:hypothetical protein
MDSAVFSVFSGSAGFFCSDWQDGSNASKSSGATQVREQNFIRISLKWRTVF